MMRWSLNMVAESNDIPLAFYASAVVTVVAGGIMFSGCPSVWSILVNATSQERLDGIFSNSAQMSTSTQG